MKNKNKITILILGIFGFLLGIFIFNFYYFYDDVNMETNANDKEVNNRLITIMLEETRGSGTYKVSKSSKWPGKGYIFNEEMSYCKNDSKLTWNENDNSVSVKVNKADKCFVYFDVEPGDINITLNNYSNTVGKSASIKCSNSNVVYNELYNRIEVSDINAKYEKCYVNYEERETKTNFADYIMSLEGTEQGDGQLVRETANIPDYTNTSVLEESEYTSLKMYSTVNSGYYSDSTVNVEISNLFTFSDGVWSSNTTLMENVKSMYYVLKFKPKESGYYQICFNTPDGKTNSISTYVNNYKWVNYNYSLTNSLNECKNLAYVSSDDYISIGQYLYTNHEIINLSFSIKKVNNITTMNAGYRYQGKNPNNYIWFNNEYWRIIGVFDENSHGQKDKNMVKIIRNELLNGLSISGSQWNSSNLNKILNEAYYNAIDGTNLGCYVYYSYIGNCNYKKMGYKKIIEIWLLM